MTETIETFVAKLQEEGVQAGRAAAERLQAEAQVRADRILADAQAQAKKILAEAEVQARALRERAQTDLTLAARDTVAQLRETLCRCLEAVIAQASRQVLCDVEFLRKALHEIVLLYAQADRENKIQIDINVPEDMQQKLKSWALKEVGAAVKTPPGAHPSLDLKGRLQQAGFEYSVGDGGTVEVTQDAVVELLRRLVTPALRDVLDQAIGRKKE